MDQFIDQILKLATEQLDLLLIVAIVFIVQQVKKCFPKAPKKLWMLVMIACGFLTAWVVTPTVLNHGKEFLRQGLIYSAGSELLYQTWKLVVETAKSRFKKG
jgi:MFS superfamily sulfate permease-like transporter